MEGINGFQHPLQTPIILECIFKHLDNIEDLKDSRLVCRAWRDASRKAMTTSAQVEISCNESSPRGISKFMELVESEESTFFQGQDKLLADHVMLEDGKGDSPEFWKAVGTHIKSLRMVAVEFQSADSFRQAIFQSCPNLEYLKLSWVKVHGEQVREPKGWVPPNHSPNANLKSLEITGIDREFSVTWLEILSTFPSLEKLSINEIGDSARYEEAFGALEIARQHDSSCWNLKEVDFGRGNPTIFLPPSFTRIFGGGDLTLTSLAINYFLSKTKEEVTTVQKILAAHAHSLKKLALETCFDDILFPLPCNQMFEKVHVLFLCGVKWRSTRFLQAFPNVKKLTLDVDEIPEDIPTPHVTLNHCTQLTLYNRTRTNEEFETVLNLLPNLKVLSASGMNNEWFSMICQAWPKLTHLHLFDGIGLDDMGLTGYDEDDVRKINKEGREGSWRPITVRRANLTSLKNLQSFWWKLSSEDSSKLGYCSEACGVLELPELKYFCVDLHNNGNKVEDQNREEDQDGDDEEDQDDDDEEDLDDDDEEDLDDDDEEDLDDDDEEDQDDDDEEDEDQSEEKEESIPLFGNLEEIFTWYKTQEKRFEFEWGL